VRSTLCVNASNAAPWYKKWHAPVVLRANGSRIEVSTEDTKSHPPATGDADTTRNRQTHRRCVVTISVAPGLGAHQPNRRLRLAQERQDRHGKTEAVATTTNCLACSIFRFLRRPPLLLRDDIREYRVLSFSVAATYAVSLSFFLFFPVPERWSYPDSGAILLSDLWTSSLIESFRPISSLDNCFPSFHVATVVLLILVAFLFRLRMRVTLLALGLTIVLSTWTLGIHWVMDIVAGLAVGVLGVALACRFERRLGAPAGVPAAGSGPKSPRPAAPKLPETPQPLASPREGSFGANAPGPIA